MSTYVPLVAKILIIPAARSASKLTRFWDIPDVFRHYIMWEHSVS